MRSSGAVPSTSPSSRGHASQNDYSPGNSGSQYALCALGVGLVALGVVMVVWSVVPADHAGNSSSTGGKPNDRSRASSVAFVLVGAGVTMLLLSLCLGMRNKRREQQRLQEVRIHTGAESGGADEEDGETVEEQAQRYNVPSYEEAVGTGQYPVRQSNHRLPSTSQLPSYDDLVDSVQVEFEGTELSPVGSQPTSAAATVDSADPETADGVPTAGRRPGKNSRKLLPLKIRRIKSEKLRMKNSDNSQPPGGISIEPLTPPPQYEDKVPPL